MSNWERCLAQEADEFAECEAGEADTLAAMYAQWHTQPTPAIEDDEWDENEYDYGY